MDIRRHIIQITRVMIRRFYRIEIEGLVILVWQEDMIVEFLFANSELWKALHEQMILQSIHILLVIGGHSQRQTPDDGISFHDDTFPE